MKYTVVLQNKAISSLESIFAYIAQDNPTAAERHIHDLYVKCQTLKMFPSRCPLAFRDSVGGIEIRHLIYDRYRIIFTVSGKTVHVLDIRHSARLSAKDSSS